MRQGLPVGVLLIAIGALAVGGSDLLGQNLQRWSSLVASIALIGWWVGENDRRERFCTRPVISVVLGLGAFMATIAVLWWLSTTSTP